MVCVQAAAASVAKLCQQSVKREDSTWQLRGQKLSCRANVQSALLSMMTGETRTGIYLRRHVLGRAAGGLADRLRDLVLAVTEVAQLHVGPRLPAVQQHVVQLRRRRKQ